ncbi:hypothetical protein N7U49_09195 [Streptomyces sp. AD2-2]|nr:hypothetical protein N7U49_09195 [Streptomyces sp. AD2-2]
MANRTALERSSPSTVRLQAVRISAGTPVSSASGPVSAEASASAQPPGPAVLRAEARP